MFHYKQHWYQHQKLFELDIGWVCKEDKHAFILIDFFILMLDLLMERGYPVMLVGGAGSGKFI